MKRPQAGAIVLVDWRTGAVPQEPSKIRPAIVVEGEDLFPEGYPNILVVPLTRDEGLAYPAFAERIEPTPQNGAEATSWALGHHVTTVSMRRVQATPSCITLGQLQSLRQRVSLALGLSA